GQGEGSWGARAAKSLGKQASRRRLLECGEVSPLWFFLFVECDEHRRFGWALLWFGRKEKTKAAMLAALQKPGVGCKDGRRCYSARASRPGGLEGRVDFPASRNMRNASSLCRLMLTAGLLFLAGSCSSEPNR